MLTIAWDVDDVLNDLMASWFEVFCQFEKPSCELGYSELVQNPPHKVLGISLDAYLKSLDRFCDGGGDGRLRVNTAIQEWMRTEGRRCRHIGVTARHSGISSLRAWVAQHFGLQVYTPLASRTAWLSKGIFLQREYPERDVILVDDSTEMVKDAWGCGINAVLYPQPWNESEQSVSDLLEFLGRKVCETI